MKKLVKVYSIGEAVLPTRLETLVVYSFYWQFDGKRVYVELCRDSIAALHVNQYSDDATVVSVEVYSLRGSGCWEDAVGALPGNLIVPHYALAEYYDAAARDSLLECVGTRLRGLSLRKTLSPWSALVIGVCQQNASFLQGWRMVYNIYVLYGERYRVGDHIYIALPPPESVREDMLREARLGYRARILADAAKLLAHMGEGQVERSELVDALSQLKGIGPYTLGLVSLLYLGRTDATVFDRWIEALVSKAYNVPPGAKARAEWRNKWGQWQGLASYHLTIVFDAEPLRRALQRLDRNEKCPSTDPDKPTPLTLWKASRRWPTPVAGRNRMKPYRV